MPQFIAEVPLTRHTSEHHFVAFSVRVGATVAVTATGDAYSVQVLGLESDAPDLVSSLEHLTEAELADVDEALCDAARRAGV